MKATNPNRVMLAISGVALLAGTLLAVSPAPSAAQDCWTCDFNWATTYHECNRYGAGQGRGDCKDPSLPFHYCLMSGTICVRQTTAATDEQAVSKVIGGDMLPAGGAYFFVMDGAEAIVMRKCDQSLVARVPRQLLARADRESQVDQVPERIALAGEGQRGDVAMQLQA